MLYGVPWCNEPHLFRHFPMDGPQGRIEDLGPASQPERNRRWPVAFFEDHVGGMTFGPDGNLYYVISRWPAETQMGVAHWAGEGVKRFRGIVVQLNPQTLERRDFAELDRGDGKSSHYVSRGSMDRNGDLFFGNVGGTPSGIFRLPMECEEKPALRLRVWG